eukprot:30495_1
MHINSLNLSDQTHDSLQNYFLITNYGDRRTILLQIKKRFHKEEDNKDNKDTERLEESQREKKQLAKERDRLKEDNQTLLMTLMLESMNSQREIIHIQIGLCGNNIGHEFWKTMGKEHKLDLGGKFFGRPKQKDAELRLANIGVYYQETAFLRFSPRACLIDLDPSVIDCIKSSALGK